MAVRVVVGNHKGGSGKTVAVVNLAAALAEEGLRVLVVDLDPQGNASRRLRARPEPQTVTIAEAIYHGGEGVAAEALRPCGWDGLYSERIDVIPSRFDLENRVAEAGQVGAVLRLKRALAGVDDDHEVTLVDCPPSLGHLTQLGLAASQLVIGSVEPEYDSVEGAVRFRDFVAAPHVREGLANPDLRVAGWLIARVRAGLGAHTYQIEGLAEAFGPESVWSPAIPERAVIKDAADAAMPLRALTNNSAARPVADIFTELARRIIKEVHA